LLQHQRPPPPHPVRLQVAAADAEVAEAVAPRPPGLLHQLHLLLPLRLRVMLRLLPLLPLRAVVEAAAAAEAVAVVETRRLQVRQPLRFPVMLRLQAQPRRVVEAAVDGVVEALLLRMRHQQHQRAHSPTHCRKPIPLEFSGRRRAPGIPSSTPIGR
jgi:hypothetical protein